MVLAATLIASHRLHIEGIKTDLRLFERIYREGCEDWREADRLFRRLDMYGHELPSLLRVVIEDAWKRASARLKQKFIAAASHQDWWGIPQGVWESIKVLACLGWLRLRLSPLPVRPSLTTLIPVLRVIHAR